MVYLCNLLQNKSVLKKFPWFSVCLFIIRFEVFNSFVFFHTAANILWDVFQTKFFREQNEVWEGNPEWQAWILSWFVCNRRAVKTLAIVILTCFRFCVSVCLNPEVYIEQIPKISEFCSFFKSLVGSSDQQCHLFILLLQTCVFLVGLLQSLSKEYTPLGKRSLSYAICTTISNQYFAIISGVRNRKCTWPLRGAL